MRKYTPIIATGMFISPMFVFAILENTQGLITAVGGLVSQATIVVGGIALLVFLWGLAKFIFKANDPEANEEGKNIMRWGLIALFVMVSVWGIIGFLQRELGLPVTVQNGQSSGAVTGNCTSFTGNTSSGYTRQQCNDAGGSWSN